MTAITIEASDGPVFLCPRDSDSMQACNYYRAVLPARMTGGTIQHHVEASLDGGPWTPFYLYSPQHVAAAQACNTLALRGFGRPTVITGRAAASAGAMPLMRLVDAAFPQALIMEWDDDVSTPDLAERIAYVLRPVVRLGVDAYGGSGVSVSQIRAAVSEMAKQSATMAQKDVYTSARRHVVATESLRARVLRQNPAAVVCVGPNAIDRDFDAAAPRVPFARVRVGYAATFNHAEDAALAFNGLTSVAQDGADVHFIGWHPRYPEVADLAGRYEYGGLPYRNHGVISGFGDFHARIAQWDVAIAPLVDSAFNRCKSPQKWFEHALHETPMVVSDLAPYSCVEHGVTGFKARNAGEFAEYLKLLCSDAELRARIGKAARAAVLAKHSTDVYAAQWQTAVTL